MKILIWCQALAFLAITSTIFAQKNHPMTQGGVSDKESLLCTTLDDQWGNLLVEGSNLVIHEAGINKLPTQLRKKYMYEVPESSLKLTNLRLVPGQPKITFDIQYIGPDRATIASRLRQEDPAMSTLNEVQLNPICVLGYAIRYPGADPDLVDCGAGKGIDETFPGELTFPLLTMAKAAYENLQQRNTFIQFEYVIGKNLQEWVVSAKYSRSNTLNSDAYRNLVSPVKGNDISVFQANVAMAAVLYESNIEITVSGQPTFTTTILSRILDGAIQTSTKNWISLADAASKKLIDLTNARYATDILKKMDTYSENVSDEEWCQKNRSEFKRQIENMKKSNKLGSGNANFFGIKFGGGGGSSYERSAIDHLEKLIANEDCGSLRSILKESFAFDGTKYTPKGLFITEFIEAIDDVREKQKVEIKGYSHEIRKQTYRLKYK